MTNLTRELVLQTIKSARAYAAAKPKLLGADRGPVGSVELENTIQVIPQLLSGRIKAVV